MGPGGSFKKLNDSFLTEECAHEISSYFSLEVCSALTSLPGCISHPCGFTSRLVSRVTGGAVLGGRGEGG